MCKQLLFACLAVALLRAPEQLYAQFTDPNNYDNAPVGLNQLEFDYYYAHSDASIDPSLIVAGATFNLNHGIIDYTHYFGFIHRLAWVEATLPLAGLSGSINGTNIGGSVAGTGDSSYIVAALLKGGPALSVAQFENYEPTTTVGVSLTITAPTGQYDANKVLNLGSNRWSFKPEFAVSHPFGPEQKWRFDAYANADFYTDNTTYQRTKVLRQLPLPDSKDTLFVRFGIRQTCGAPKCPELQWPCREVRLQLGKGLQVTRDDVVDSERDLEQRQRDKPEQTGRSEECVCGNRFPFGWLIQR